MESKYVPVADAKKHFGSSKQHMYSLHHRGIITLKKIGGRTYVDVLEFEGAMKDLPRKQPA